MRPDVQLLRALWRADMLGHEPSRFVFIDETWAKTNMTRTRGRAPVGQRLVAYAPHGHWQTTTFIGALRVDGLTAPLVFDGPINGEIFFCYVRDHLVPTLKAGDVVVMDNLGSHKVEGVRQAIEAAGAKIACLPPYSPDLNPIEQAFSKLKAHLRKHAERTREKLWDRIGDLIGQYQPTEYRNFFKY